ncbi:hypothetical protein BO94DRAFT_576220 [Aspergillus sclerotioniger CBS 115572]|uniref:Uncharacterized protein n=1 Tax=Aspergillus sclerotioniger CBS 115572 TaxID=1450535 RepID=A0A317WFL5_9EURO|nr:hypothetical protein BO94DRAFT_576220 [Aspergillus sclerotioniger CBS 115572]PWY83798.1 hypothetical protein BO94DRAFT_576220 [Aspergillus sclerotioniger CBS 115572]
MSNTNTSEQVEFLSAQDLIKENFPDIIDTSKYSSGTGLHRINFKGKLEYWEGFQRDVRKVFREIPWEKHGEALTVRLKTREDLQWTEHFLCGAEISTKRLAYPKKKPDGKNESDEKHSIPDYALICRIPRETRALGEAKHPWGTHPDVDVQDARRGIQLHENRLRRLLGQISRDMWAAKLKFAFMTNYRWTVFLRREMVNGKWTLYYSDAIPHDAVSDLDGKTRGCVSVRECMLYLVHTVSGAQHIWSSKNQPHEPLPEWAEGIPKSKPKSGSTAQLPARSRPLSPTDLLT